MEETAMLRPSEASHSRYQEGFLEEVGGHGLRSEGSPGGRRSLPGGRKR